MSAPLNPSGAGSCCAPICSNSPQFQVPGPAGVSAYTFTEAGFTVPSVGSTVLLTVQNTIWMGAENIIFIEGAGYYEVSSIPDATHVLAVNLGYTGNAAPLQNIGFPSKVVPGGQGGTLINAFSTTTANFTMPNVLANVTIQMLSTAWTAPGAYIFVQNAGTFQVVSITNGTNLVAENLGYPGNAAPTTVIPLGQAVISTGQRGAAGTSGANSLNGAGGLSPTTTKGDILVDNGGQSPNPNLVRVGVGSDGKALVADSAQASGTNYATITPNAAATDGDIAIFNGTTGKPMALKDSKLLITSDGAIQSTPSGGNARGSKATDLQIDRSAITQVASGANSTLIGGKNNTAAATDACIAGGNGNSIAAGATDASISGGLSNSISAAGVASTISGGGANSITAASDFIGGGSFNEVDGAYSAILGGNTNIVKGAESMIGGGSNNETDAQNSAILGGANNLIDAAATNAAILGGGGAHATLYGQAARASGEFAAGGDAQTSELLWRKLTTDATANVESFLDGSTARAVIPINTTWAFEIYTIARSSAGVCAMWKTEGAIQNNGGTVSLVAAVSQTVVSDGTGATWGVTANHTVDADNTNKSLRIRSTGAVATNIRWVTRARLVEVGF